MKLSILQKERMIVLSVQKNNFKKPEINSTLKFKQEVRHRTDIQILIAVLHRVEVQRQAGISHLTGVLLQVEVRCDPLLEQHNPLTTPQKQAVVLAER